MRWRTSYGEHSVGGFGGEGGERKGGREREGESETTGYEPLREAQTVVAGEGSGVHSAIGGEGRSNLLVFDHVGWILHLE